MKMIPGSRRRQYLTRLSLFLITMALIIGMVGCDGDGYTPSQNLKIWDWYDLDAIRDNLGGSHVLMKDLNSTTLGYEELASPTANEGKGWQPIGTYDIDSQFTGTFDGQGYEIRDLFINRPDENDTGLFGSISKGGSIENIGLVNVDVTGWWAVGGLVGVNWGTVSNSYATSSVTGSFSVGGLAGLNLGTVSNSYATGSVTGDNNIGGLVGWNEGNVRNSYSTGNVSGVANVGGLVGLNEGGTVSNSYSAGNVIGNLYVGGLVGASFGNVSNSFWDTQTSGQPTSSGGTGENTTEMQDIATFSGAGWNITAVALNQTNPYYIWNIVDNVTYPFLSWQP